MLGDCAVSMIYDQKMVTIKLYLVSLVNAVLLCFCVCRTKPEGGEGHLYIIPTSLTVENYSRTNSQWPLALMRRKEVEGNRSDS